VKYAKAFIDSLRVRGYKRATLAAKARNLAAFGEYLRQYHGKDAVATVTRETIESYKRHLLNVISSATKRKYSRVAVIIKLIAVKDYFKYLADERRLLLNPTVGLRLPKEVRGLPKNILSETEIARVIEKPDLSSAAGLRNRAILEVMYSTGIRAMELLNLDVYDIDLEHKTLTVRKGKNSKDRVVPIGKTACVFLKRYLKQRAQAKHSDAALFLTMGGGRMTHGTLSWVIRGYAGTLYPAKHVTCHTFRHCCATHLMRGGASIRVVQQLLGHARISSTQVYTRLCAEDLKDTHRRCHPSGKQKYEGKNSLRR
jgi:integrase/recombinase XerD